jgi:hypothetical protein
MEIPFYGWQALLGARGTKIQNRAKKLKDGEDVSNIISLLTPSFYSIFRALKRDSAPHASKDHIT